jgi:hypothetical protein
VDAKSRVIQQVLRAYLRESASIGKPAEESVDDVQD